MSIERKCFGVLENGEEASLFSLRAGEMTATVTDYGAILVAIMLPAGKGNSVDVALGFSTLAGYAAKHPYFGATVGRYANRIGGASFTLDGRAYPLAANNGRNHLHGGLKGFDKHLWRAEPSSEGGDPLLRLSRISPDGEEGYPGSLEASVTYRLGRDGSLGISYDARSTSRTIVNLTNHSYFNLKGEGRGDILDHELRLACSRYIPVGPDQIPSGRPVPAAGGPFDFSLQTRIGDRIEATGNGYDHCFVIDEDARLPKSFAELVEPVSGRRMTVSTTLPGVQFYSGNNLAGVPGKRGSMYGKHAGLCLETELFPDSPNRPDFPSSVLEPGGSWKHETVYRFAP